MSSGEESETVEHPLSAPALPPPNAEAQGVEASSTTENAPQNGASDVDTEPAPHPVPHPGLLGIDTPVSSSSIPPVSPQVMSPCPQSPVEAELPAVSPTVAEGLRPHQRFTEECYENERYSALSGWGSNMLPVDRQPFTDKTGRVNLRREAFQLPKGWHWVDDWEVDVYPGSTDGWYYAVDFTVSIKDSKPKAGWTSFCRRRRWRRTREYDPEREVDVAQWSYLTLCNMRCYGFAIPSDKVMVRQQRIQHEAFTYLLPALSKQSKDKPSKGGASGDADARGQHLNYSPPRGGDATSPLFECTGANVGKTLRDVVWKYGVPCTLRRKLWRQWSGGATAQAERTGEYRAILETPLDADKEIYDEIMLDVVRTAADHPYFSRDANGAQKLLRVLVALTRREPKTVYFQPYSFMVAVLLCNMDEEEAFFVMCRLLDSVLPGDFHSGCGVLNLVPVVHDILAQQIPPLGDHFARHGIDCGPFVSGWFQGLFAAHFSVPAACRVWDLLFLEGPNVLLRLVIGFLQVNGNHILHEINNTGSLLGFANDYARKCWDVEEMVASARALTSRKMVQQAQQRTGGETPPPGQ